LEVLNDGRSGRFRAHVNWVPATYEGFLDWQGASAKFPFGDNDFTFALTPVESDGSARGYTARRAALTPYPADGPDALHIEFNAAEVSDYFEHTWWKTLRDRADGDENPALSNLSTSRFAVVTGLLGLDAEHKGHSELHPVYAMALQTQCTTPDATGHYLARWAIFVRNWGNEGFCSSYNCYHSVVLDKANPNEGGTFSVRLPLGVTDATEVELTNETEFWGWAGGSAIEVSNSVDVDLGAYALVRVRLPGPEAMPLLYGEVTLKFRASGSGGCPIDPRPEPVAALTRAPLAKPERRGAEGMLAELGRRAQHDTALRQESAPRPPEHQFTRIDPSTVTWSTTTALATDPPLRCPASDKRALEASSEKDAICAAVRALSAADLKQDRRLAEILKACGR